MLPLPPYLIEAFYKWIVDSNGSPFVVIDATFPGIKIPEDLVQDNKIVFNLSKGVAKKLKLNLDKISFESTFDEQKHSVVFSTDAVIAIYDESSGEGTALNCFLGNEEDFEDLANFIEQRNSIKSQYRLIVNENFIEDKEIVSGHKVITKNKPMLTIVT